MVQNGSINLLHRMAANEYGWWYVQNGSIISATTDLLLMKWMVYGKGGKVDFNYTGLVEMSMGGGMSRMEVST